MKQMQLNLEQKDGIPSGEQDIVLQAEVIRPVVALMASALIAVVHAAEQSDDAR